MLFHHPKNCPNSRLTGQCFLACTLLAFLAATISPVKAAEASFDCAKSRTDIEKTICASDEISKQDKKMLVLYQAALAKLSPIGKANLKEGQKSWLHFRNKYCGSQPQYNDDKNYTVKGCLESEYEDRIKILQNAAVINGPYLFSILTHYSATLFDKSDRREGYPPLHEDSQSIPIIDAPLNAQTKAWNDKVRIFSKFGQPGSTEFEGPMCGISILGFESGFNYVTNLAISVTFTMWDYSCGGVHGNWYTQTLNFLMPEGRELEAKDLFRNKGWENVALTFTLKTLNAACAKDCANPDYINKYYPPGEPPKDVDYADFGISRKNLFINLGTFFGYTQGDQIVEVPWSKLETFLTPIGKKIAAGE